MGKYQYAIDIAIKLLNDLRITEAPIDVEAIASSLDIQIIKKKLEDEFAGAALREGNHKVIIVNKSDSVTRQRFTIAHEIGHLLLHHGTTLHVDTHFRNSKSSLGIDEKEIEANKFAAELLMPQGWLENDPSFQNIDISGENETEWLDNLAKKYHVSKQALLVRISSLGLLTI